MLLALFLKHGSGFKKQRHNNQALVCDTQEQAGSLIAGTLQLSISLNKRNDCACEMTTLVIVKENDS